jgi:hypothetical protein
MESLKAHGVRGGKNNIKGALRGGKAGSQWPRLAVSENNVAY